MANARFAGFWYNVREMGRNGFRDVAFSCDDRGAKFLRVTVWSLLSHYHGFAPVRINVFEGFWGHSEGGKRVKYVLRQGGK